MFAALFASVSVIYSANIFSVFSLPPPISFDVLICFADELHCFFSEVFPAITSAAIYRQVVPTTLYSVDSPSPQNLFKVKEKWYNKKMRKKYPSDITRAQFEHIRGILESGKKKTAPRKVDLYEIFCAILYLLKSGCQWRMLPETFPKWNTVYYYFSIWNKAQDEKPSLLHQCLKKID